MTFFGPLDDFRQKTAFLGTLGIPVLFFGVFFTFFHFFSLGRAKITKKHEKNTKKHEKSAFFDPFFGKPEAKLAGKVTSGLISCKNRVFFPRKRWSILRPQTPPRGVKIGNLPP
jgi:hypothetical protein